MNDLIKKIIKPENDIETAICQDVEFITGCSYGKARRGHPEGQVIYHIKEVLANIDKYYGDDEDRQDLRLIAILHDTFKHKVNNNLPKTGENHHGAIARRFAQKYINNYGVCKIIEVHDDAYNAWCKGSRYNDWTQAERKANQLIQGLMNSESLDLYLKFYRCDNETGDKSQECLGWFNDLIQ